MTKQLMARIEKVNGFGWFIHALWTLFLVGVSAAGLYWGIIARIDSVDVESRIRSNDLRTQMALYHQADSLATVAQNTRLSNLWGRAQVAHKEMMRRVGVRWDWEHE